MQSRPPLRALSVPALPAAAFLASFLLAVSPARAIEVFTFSLDPNQSFIEAVQGLDTVVGPAPLSGSLTIQFDDPPTAGATGFQILTLEATGTDTVLSLDDSLFQPTGTASSGVLLFSDFLVLDGLIPAVPPATGSQLVNVGKIPGFGTYALDAGGDVTSVFVPFAFDAEGTVMWTLHFVAVPEPAPDALLLLGALLGCASRVAKNARAHAGGPAVFRAPRP